MNPQTNPSPSDSPDDSPTAYLPSQTMGGGPDTSRRQTPFNIGKYVCEEYLGGNMADVYRARDTRTERNVVVKILKHADSQEGKLRQRFDQEVKLATKCSHPNVISTFDADEFEGSPYIVMEYLPGKLLTRENDPTPIGQPEMLYMALQVADALRYIHGLGIVHRDLKLDNIRLDAAGRPKLIDFGIAHTDLLTLTQFGEMIGTPLYMSPEQVQGQKVDHRTDIFSFGILLYILLTRTQPYNTDITQELWGAIIYGSPDLDRLRVAGTSELVVELVAMCLQKNPDDRYPDFGPICEILERAIQPESSQGGIPVPVVAAPSRMKPAVMAIVLGFAIALGIGIGAVIMYWQNRLPAELLLPSGKMVLVKGGYAYLGRNNDRRKVDDFYIDVTEVSNEAYARFCHETQHGLPRDFAADKPELPVVNVTFDDAQAFAAWAGKRLPVATEWEKAARSTDGRKFPWGNDARSGMANVPLPQGAELAVAPVYSFEKGASRYGVLNLCGNVWEWVNTPEKPQADVFKALQQHLSLPTPLSADETFYQIRGGSFESNFYEDLSDFVADGAVFPARAGARDVGFRCARNASR